MKTATMVTPPLPTSAIALGRTEASESVIDAYATRVLESMSPPEAIIDTSLGPYVTSLLRCAAIQDKNQLTKLGEYESLLELLEDQCGMDQKTASSALETIADAVASHVMPFEPSEGNSNVTSPNFSQVKLGPFSGVGIDSFHTLRSSLPSYDPVDSSQNASLPNSSSSLLSVQTRSGTEASDSYPPNSTAGPSHLKPDNLIPFDLLGVLDDPSPDQQGQKSHSYTAVDVTETRTLRQSSNQPSQQSTTSRAAESRRLEQQQNVFPPLSESVDSFPPLGASSTEKPKKTKLGGSRKAVIGKTHPHSDKDLAAALFRPARQRQNSIENDDVVGMVSSTIRPTGQSLGSGTDELDGHHSNIYFQQQLSSCIEILLSMNEDLSEEAATEAAIMSNTDFNIAHYLVDAAMAAPPVCRHMLHEGCYRSDCHFSHDVEGHTCLFWIRGRCGKGSACRFLHGFNEKILNDIPSADKLAPPGPPVSQQLHVPDHFQGLYSPITIYGSNYADPVSTGGYDYAPQSGASVIDGYGSNLPQLSSSWQPPALADFSSATNSYSSGDNSLSFAKVASKDSEKTSFAGAPPPRQRLNVSNQNTSIVRIPQDLWNPHENRDSSVFYIADPLERYYKVAMAVRRSDVIDLHFQSTKTFSVVLHSILPLKLAETEEVWIVTGTGHHVGSKTHQKGGGALERAVIQWLSDQGYHFSCGKDRNGLGGALLVKR